MEALLPELLLTCIAPLPTFPPIGNQKEEEMCTAIHSSHYPPLRHYFRCRPRCYIRLVQHLIEKCLTFDMDRDAVVAALAKYASIEPVVTITVWNELLKENPAFFSSYFEAQQRRLRNTQLIQHALSS